MTDWLQDAETGEYFRADELDPSTYTFVEDAPAPSSPEAGWGDVLQGGLLSGVSSIGKGASGLLQAGGDAISNLPLIGGVGEAISDFGRETADYGRGLDRQLASELNLSPGSWKELGFNVAGTALPAVTALGAAYAAPFAGGAAMGPVAATLAPASSLGAVAAGNKYTTLKDIGVDTGRALLDAGATMGVQSAVNAIPFGALQKAGGGLVSNTLMAGAGNVAGSVLGLTGDVLTDRAFAPENVPTAEDFNRLLGTGVATSLATAPVFGAIAAGGKRAQGARAAAIDDARALLDSLPKQQAVVQSDLPVPTLALPAPDGVIYGDGFTATAPSPEQAAISAAMDLGPEKAPLSAPVDSPPILPDAGPLASTTQDSPLPPSPSGDIAPPVTTAEALSKGPPPEEARITEYLTKQLDKKTAESARLEALTKEMQEKANFDVEAREKQNTKPDADIPIIKAPSGEGGDVVFRDYSKKIITDTSKKTLDFFKNNAKALSSEKGMLDLDMFSSLFKQAKEVDDKILSRIAPMNRAPSVYHRYREALSRFEWLDTTARKSPEVAPAVEAMTRLSPENNLMRADVLERLRPAMELNGDDKVNSYVNALSEDSSRVHSSEAMKAFGLNEKQMKAVDGIRTNMKEFTNLLSDDELAQQHHIANLTTQRLQRARSQIASLIKRGKITAEEGLKRNLSLTEQEGRATAKLQGKTTQIENLRSEWLKSNYSPMNHDGDFGLEIRNADGSIAEYRFVETEKQANKLALEFAKEGFSVHPFEAKRGGGRKGERISQDILAISEDGPGYGIEGFRRHLIKRKGFKGYNPNAVQANVEYSLGAARRIAFRRMNRQIEATLEALPRDPNAIPGPDGSLPVAVEYQGLVDKLQLQRKDLMTAGSATFRAVNKFIDLSFLTMQLRAPIGNAISVVSRQWPELTNYVPGGVADKTFSKALLANSNRLWMPKKTFAKAYGQELANGLELAEKKGIIPNRELKQLDRVAQGSNRVLSTVDDAAFYFVHATDKFAESNGFLSGWYAYPHAIKKLKAEGKPIPSRQQFAEDFAFSTKPNPDSSILPHAFRNEAFKGLTKYRMWWVAAMRGMSRAAGEKNWGYLSRAIGATLATSGVVGLPFAKAMIAAANHFGIDPKKEAMEFFKDTFGEETGARVGRAAIYGPISEYSGVNISGLVGLGDTIQTSEPTLAGVFGSTVAGPYYGLGSNINEAVQSLIRGDTGRGLEKLPIGTPVLSSALQANRLDKEGLVTKGGTQLLSKEEVTPMDKALKLLGLTSMNLTNAYDKQAAGNIAVRSGGGFGKYSYNKEIGKALARGDSDKVRSLIREAIEEGNKIDSDSIKDAFTLYTTGDERIQTKHLNKADKLKWLRARRAFD